MNLKKKISKKSTIGAWMQTSSLDNAEILAKSDFDWIAIDLEHGNISNEKVKNMTRVIQANKKTVFARMPSSDPLIVGNILDSGVNGIIIPHIKNAQQVKSIINKSFYPPFKNRGIGFSKSNDYGAGLRKSFKKNRDLVVIAMIENKEGFKNLNKILKVKYLDGVFIGPYDLSASLNLFEKFNDKKFLKVIEKIKNITLNKKKLCGIHVVNFNKGELKKRVKEGYNFIAYSMDTVVMRGYNKKN
jgi:2-keto-3-deoxy-L-rhamnonate aldolase RhmA